MCALIIASIINTITYVALMPVWTHHFVIAYRVNSNSHFAYCIFFQLHHAHWIIQSGESYVPDITRNFLHIIIIFIIFFFFGGINFDVNHFAASDSETMLKTLIFDVVGLAAYGRNNLYFATPKWSVRTTQWATCVDKHWQKADSFIYYGDRLLVESYSLIESQNPNHFLMFIMMKWETMWLNST